MFLANENFPFPSIALLREQGYMVESIGETYHGISDEEVLQIANFIIKFYQFLSSITKFIF